ncbi:hypothetical protein [Paenibacillus donghaensis]|uniref:Uncharacterized protein n=1 Tax=Paenibacillus donghaensis TaxID=414771 RepID=A0A2Z2KG04_9BACL|nr:hypothetical protein [Paenibacillus donghaensis]ASA22935.1 hypothetical protein B9T62_20260 [Paenibacillus donghaensis]
MARAGISSELGKALGRVTELLSLNGREERPVWLLGGSCSLALQQVPLQAAPRDVDLYAELAAAKPLHEALSDFALGEPEEDFSRGCYSLISRYRIEETAVELICGFRMNYGGSQYIVDTGSLLPHAPLLQLTEGGQVRLMPLAHEFLFNAIRGRADRYERIAAVMRKDAGRHLPLLQSLVQRNGLEAAFALQLDEWLQAPLSQAKSG